MDGTVSLREVLEVLDEFERLEPSGVSLELIAWELYQPDAAVAELIELARERQLIEFVGADSRTGEALWRLTRSGRASTAASRGPS